MIAHLTSLVVGLSLIEILGFIALIIGLAVLVYAHLSDDPFDLRYLVVDEISKKLSSYKFAFLVCLIVMSYGFVVLLNQGKMTEWYAGLYAGTFVAGRIFGKDRNPAALMTSQHQGGAPE